MKKVRIITHGGGFHADDVFSVAAVKKISGSAVEIIRTREAAVIQSGDFVVDVGGECDEGRNRFDHHQISGAGVRANGIPYAAFGLVWKKFGPVIAGSAEAARLIEERLVMPLDANDTGTALVESGRFGIFPYLIQDAFESLKPTWREEGKSFDDGFFEALFMAEQILDREVIRAGDAVKGAGHILAAYDAASDKRLVVLEKDYFWEEILSAKPEPIFVVLPDGGNGGNWKINAVRTEPHSFESRELLPVQWAGKRDSELASLTGVSDAVFCHTQRFLAVAGSKKGAVALAKIALSK